MVNKLISLLNAWGKQHSTKHKNDPPQAEVKMEQAYREMVKELQVINEMSQTFTASLNLQQVLQAIIGQIGAALPAHACSIFLINEDNGDLVLSASLGELDFPDELRRLSSGQDIVSWVVEHARPQLVADVTQDKRYYPKIGQTTGLTAGSIICAPIMRADRVLGAIQSINRNPNAFTETHLRLLTTASNHAAIALENAQLYKETVRRLSQVSILQVAGAQLTATFEIEPLLEMIVSSSVSLVGADSGSILWVDKKKATEARRLGLENHQTQSPTTVPIHPEGMTHKILQQGKIKVVTDAGQIANLDGYVTQHNWKAFIGIPLKRGRQLLGVLYIASNTPRQFADYQISLLETFVSQAILAIEHVSLYQETRENLKRITTLYEVSQTARYLRDRQRALKFVTTSIKRYFQTGPVMVFELSDEGFLAPIYMPNVPREKISAYLKNPWYIIEPDFFPLSLGESIQIGDLQDPQHNALKSRLIYSDAKSWYAIPLQVTDKILGALVLVGRQTALVPNKELQFLYAVAGNIGVAMENIRLIEELEAQTKALRETNQQLIQANKIKSRFMATMSHELRTPLNSIIGYSHVLQEELEGPLTPGQVESVNLILQNGQHLLMLINDILDLSKVEAGRLDIYPYQFPVYQVIDATLSVMSPLAEQKGLPLVVEPFSNSLMVYADQNRLRQILLNLLSNAVKFTATGQVSIRIEVKDGYISISVSDTGVGIPPEELAHLFDEFYQVDGSMAREYDGTGMGLAIAKRLATIMQGQIKVESEVNKGSTFTITLPQEQPQSIIDNNA